MPKLIHTTMHAKPVARINPKSKYTHGLVSFRAAALRPHPLRTSHGCRHRVPPVFHSPGTAWLPAAQTLNHLTPEQVRRKRDIVVHHKSIVGCVIFKRWSLPALATSSECAAQPERNQKGKKKKDSGKTKCATAVSD